MSVSKTSKLLNYINYSVLLLQCFRNFPHTDLI